MQFLWLILLLGTDPSCVLFLMFSLLHLWVHQMPSFLLKIFLQTNQKGTLQSNLRLGSWMSHAPLKTVGVDFICFVSSTELTSCRHHVREDISLLRWHGGGGRRKNWLQYSWAPDWVVQVSFVQQTSWQMTVRCDHGCGMWHALWKRFFSTLKKKKKKKRCDSLYTVTCQDNNRLRRQFGAGFPLLLQPPLQPARQGEFQWTLSLGCTES